MLKIKNILNTKVKGVAGFESILLSPLMMITYMLIFYFAFTAISYIQLNNLAEVIAEDLNMKRSGYEVRDVSKPNYRFYEFDLREAIGQNSFINGYKPKSIDDKFDTTASSAAVKDALNYSIGKHGYRLFMPGIQIVEIRADAFRNEEAVTSFDDITKTGTSIEITIKYKAFGLSYTASGYNIIV